MKNENLFGSIPNLCPSVCEHWKEVAERKLAELVALREALKIPKDFAENSPPKTCRSNCGSDRCAPDGAPTGEVMPGEDLLFEQCRPIFKCNGPDREIVVKVRTDRVGREGERYKIKFDPETQRATRVSAFERRRGRKGSISFVRGRMIQKFEDKLKFIYNFDSETGDLRTIENVSWTGPHKRSDVLAVEDIVPQLGEAAYNSQSDLTANLETVRRLTGIKMKVNLQSQIENTFGRRIEISKLSREAISYCCQGGKDCRGPLPGSKAPPLPAKRENAVQ